jgi:hypothetical protein
MSKVYRFFRSTHSGYQSQIDVPSFPNLTPLSARWDYDGYMNHLEVTWVQELDQVEPTHK